MEHEVLTQGHPFLDTERKVKVLAKVAYEAKRVSFNVSFEERHLPSHIFIDTGIFSCKVFKYIGNGTYIRVKSSVYPKHVVENDFGFA